jgi:CBS domain containing-hemolysin-like protein
MPWLLVVGALLLLANGSFVAAEFALVAGRRSRMQELAAAGDARARVALGAMADLPMTLAATQLGITMASIGLGLATDVAVEESVVPLLDRTMPLPAAVLDALAAAAGLLVTLSAHTLLGEIVPKNLALAAPDRAALWLAAPVRTFTVLTRPVLVALTWLAALLMRAIRIEPRSELSSTYGVEDIAAMLELAGLRATDGELLDRAVRFATRAAGSIMVPWSRVTAAAAGTPAEELERVAIASGHSRVPVTRGDEVLGFVHVLDLQRPGSGLVLHPVLRVPTGQRLVEVFEAMRESGHRLAIVTGEAGRATGIVTLEDLLVALLGEL